MARTEKKPVHNVQMAEGKWDIIRQFLQEYGTQSASDIQDARFVFVFTPKHGSWLNLIESFFRKMTKQMLKGIRVRTKQELADLHIPGKQHNRSKGTACCSASNGIKPVNSYCA